MYTEIERKFLVCNDDWRKEAIATTFCQGYIYSHEGRFIRVRTADTQAFLTIKGPKNGISRAEFEYPIPLTDAQELLQNMAQKPLIRKIRHKVPFGKHVWEIDAFLDDNEGLIVAEIELNHADEEFLRPAWLGKEVTHVPQYRHAALARHPFCQWNTV